jgi:hypothetical protein
VLTCNAGLTSLSSPLILRQALILEGDGGDVREREWQGRGESFVGKEKKDTNELYLMWVCFNL